MTTGDVNGDGRMDILAINATDLVWFQAPAWEKHVMLTAGATVADNVTIAAHDIDRDGRLDVALGAGWTRQNTGTLQWVRQNAPGATPAWEVFPIGAEQSLHRIRWADVDGDRNLELIVAPLQGKGSTAPNWDGPGARLLVFRPPANPRADPWPMEVATEANHIQHNILPLNLDSDAQEEIVTASKEGLYALKRGAGGTWSRTLIGEGAPGEVKLGRVVGPAGPRDGRAVARQVARDLRREARPVDTHGHRIGAHRRTRDRLGRLRRRRQRRSGGRLARRAETGRGDLRRRS